MPRIICIVTAALASLAMFTQPAVAIPARDAVGTSSLAGTTSASPQGRLSCRPSSACSAPNAYARKAQADGRLAASPGPPTWPIDPEPLGPAPVEVAAPVADADDTSPLIYVLPAAIVSILLVAGVGYAVRTSARRTRVSTDGAPRPELRRGRTARRSVERRREARARRARPVQLGSCAGSGRVGLTASWIGRPYGFT